MGISHSVQYKSANISDQKWKQIRNTFCAIIKHESYKKGFLVNMESNMVSLDRMKFGRSAPMIAFTQGNGNADVCVLRMSIEHMDEFSDFSHCKTSGMSYEVYVMALFALASIIAPEVIQVFSDVDEDLWQQGLDLITNVTGKAYRPLPRDDEGVIRFEEVL